MALWSDAMRAFFRLMGWLCAGLAAALGLLGVASLPSGGLMFALPYVFFLPALFFAILAVLLLWATRLR